jgi:DNA-binding GntR family transcriptional regulator
MAEGTPKFRQVESAIHSAVIDGVLAPGSRLPDERSLASCFGVSLGTAQKALSGLARDGIVTRARRRGTFVNARKVAQEDIYVFRFRDPVSGHYVEPLIRVLSVGRETRNGPWRDFLQTDQIVRIERLMRIGVEPPVYSEFFIQLAHGVSFLDIAPEDIESASLHRHLRDRFSIPTMRIEHRLRCAAFPESVCRHLIMDAGTRGLLWEIGGYTHRDVPTSFQRIYVPPGHRAVEIESKP